MALSAVLLYLKCSNSWVILHFNQMFNSFNVFTESDQMLSVNQMCVWQLFHKEMIIAIDKFLL